MKKSDEDIRWMQRCLALAVNGSGAVSPNPMVGAVAVKNGRLIAEGWHHAFGGPHAEVECLRRAGRRINGATLYVNLEPCSHLGKTPPCSEALIRAGLRRVVVAMRDPNPMVSGRGIRELRRAGIRVDVGVCGEEARVLNRRFLTHIVRGRPYVHVKIAQTLDGRIAGPGMKWISSPESKRLVHHWRAEYDAVLVGVGTILSDDPHLTVRLAKGRNPHVAILDGKLRVPAARKVIRSATSRRVILFTSSSALRKKAEHARMLARLGVEVVGLPGKQGVLSLIDVLQELYRSGIGSVLVEGGSAVFQGFVGSGFVDELTIFQAPRTVGAGLTSFSPVTRGRPKETVFKTILAGYSGADIAIRAFREEYPALIALQTLPGR